MDWQEIFDKQFDELILQRAYRGSPEEIAALRAVASSWYKKGMRDAHHVLATNLQNLVNQITYPIGTI